MTRPLLLAALLASAPAFAQTVPPVPVDTLKTVMDESAAIGWMTGPAATQVFAAAGQDFGLLHAAAKPQDEYDAVELGRRGVGPDDVLRHRARVGRRQRLAKLEPDCGVPRDPRQGSGGTVIVGWRLLPTGTRRPGLRRGDGRKWTG